MDIFSSPPGLPTSCGVGWIEKYLEHVRVERRLAARTVELYAIHLQTLTEKADKAQLPLDQVQTAQVRRWMAQLHSAGREPRGIALVLSCWRGFYRWLGNERRIAGNPVQDVHAPTAARPLPKALAVDDAVRLAELHDTQADPWVEARDRAVDLQHYQPGWGDREANLVRTTSPDRHREECLGKLYLFVAASQLAN